VVDKETQKGVEFATISVKGKEIGTYTDSNGIFTLKNIESKDTLVVRHVAYKKEFIPVSYALKDSLITVSPEINSIREVVIKPNKYKEYSIGLSKLGSKDCIASSKGVEITTLIRDDKFKDFFIKEITFHVKEVKTPPFYIKAHVYRNDKGKPEGEIIFSNTYRIDNVKSIVKIDISEYMIAYPSEGLFVGIEWIGIIKDDKVDDNERFDLSPHIKITKKNMEATTFIRTWDKPWEDISIRFQEIPEFKGSKVNALIGLTIMK